MDAALKPSQIYSYREATGEIRYQVIRYEHDGKKTFRQRQRGNVWNLDGVPRLPYRLPELLESPETLVWIVEGEKDADRLGAAGVTATTNSGGAGNWTLDLIEWFRGRDIAICPDNDSKGEAHAVDVARKLNGVARSIRIVRLPGLPPKGDVSDFLDRNGTTADLQWLYDTSPEWTEDLAAPKQLALGPDVRQRASAYVAGMPAAIEGERGHDRLWRVANVLVNGFDLDRQTAYDIIATEYNPRCVPPWSETELRHKLDDAEKKATTKGYLIDAKPVPHTTKVAEVPKQRTLKLTTAEESAMKYIDKLRKGGITLTDMGLPNEMNTALDGGVDFGEMVVIAARPSHGKSLVAMQCLYAASQRGIPSLMVSAEMSAIALGKRTAQFVSDVPLSDWQKSTDTVETHVRQFFNGRSPVYIVDDVSTVEEVEAIVEHAVLNHDVRIVAVDYAQLLGVEGRMSTTERVNIVSKRLKQLAKRLNIVLFVLCQLGRDVERRDVFLPKYTDLKDSGQIEQDADVIIMLCWTHRVDPKVDKSEFIAFIGKNRNREIVQGVVRMKIDPRRQRIESENLVEFHGEFEDWNRGECDE